MAGSMKDIKLRIKSVESTMQITKAMELVASSKLRRAKLRVEASRPYFTELHQTLLDIAGSNTEFLSAYVKKREVKRSCFIVIAGDRGLAGGYNTNIFKQITADAAGKNYCVLPIGKKAVEYYKHAGIELVTEAFSLAADVSVSDCFELSRIVSQKYLAGEFDEIYVGYTNFVSMLSQTPATIRVLPFSCPPQEKAAGEQKGARDMILYEPDSETVFDAIVPEYIAGIVYGAMCESVASELGARRTAMDAATNNASDMIQNLNLYYNRARQAAITQEITEIVAGAEQ
ncbi:MAG: ATP synthase F1 subunit gamma [Faecalibacterium sp.]|jgi:F-type H+-transporting ATPase subunit gamma|nr:ATP synthase F1 subunit gamma [Faecalibacterium sp.]